MKLARFTRIFSSHAVRLIFAGIIFLPWVVAAPASDTNGYDWLQFGGNPQHSGVNSLETLISPANVSGLHQAFQVQLAGVADGAPVYLHSVATPGGTRNLLFLTTTDGRLLALDAKSGAQVWTQQVGAGACRVNNGTGACFTTSSPAIDPNRQFVYSYGLDGKVHKYRVADGVEVTSGGWPEIATGKGYDEKGSSSLAVAIAHNGQSFLYVANSGYPGDRGDYQGHVTAINLADGSQKVFNALCSDQPVHFNATNPDCPLATAGIWSRAPVVYDPNSDRIYLVTGNGDFNPAGHHWGDTVFALHPDGSGAGGNPLDSYTPTNFQQLQNSDTDLGSTAPAILPAISGSRYAHLAVVGGKDAQLRLLNLDNFSGKGSLGNTGGEIGALMNVPQGGAVLTQPAVWTNPQDGSVWVFVTTGAGTSGLKLSVDGNGNPSLAKVWQDSFGATSPLIA
ncbi:MAG: PQQ-binding-like beta-propeller repeat protein, partial [Anaerolineaceae bacterium]|nr:PQQ-binding-like beta-propeller repeat protein [Anaerolineaceae bacterium]